MRNVAKPNHKQGAPLKPSAKALKLGKVLPANALTNSPNSPLSTCKALICLYTWLILFASIL